MYCHRRRFFLVTVFLFVTSMFYLPALLFNKSDVEYVQITFKGKHRCAGAAAGNKKNQNGRRAKKKVILFYTTIFDRIPVFYPDHLKCCDGFNCEITQDKRNLLDSDAVIFHGRDIHNAKDMPTQRTLTQRWIFYTMENPYNSKIVPAEFNGMFNWTMTYERRSDIYVPYGYYAKKEVDSQDFRQRNHALGKDKLVTFVNSHCRTPYTLRENYIRALNRLIKVDAYGECGGIFGRMMCPRKKPKCQSLLKRYKFYLAFENGHCEDYVSEKYWNISLSIGAVPIVFGGKSFKELCIPGSYIDASNFLNVESLSKYLEYLDKNDTAYNEYFKWEQFYEKVDLEPWPCRLCRMLHNSSLHIHTYNNFDKFLDPDIVCEKHLKHFENYFYY